MNKSKSVQVQHKQSIFDPKYLSENIQKRQKTLQKENFKNQKEIFFGSSLQMPQDLQNVC